MGSVSCTRRFSRRRLFFTCGALFLLKILWDFILLAYTEYYSERSYHLSFADKKILDTTPNLWRSSAGIRNETASFRITSQREWIQKLSKTNYIKHAPIKTILVQDGMENYYTTMGRISCPYAKDFEDKCVLKEETIWDKLQGGFKYVGVAGVVVSRGWEALAYEPSVPSHVRKFMYILEPPHVSGHANLGQDDSHLISYWRGSDVPVPYRTWIAYSKPFERNVPSSAPKMSLLKNRKFCVAVMSNCDWTGNGRLEYIKELQKYVDVDVYGKCGNFTCPRDKVEECWKVFEKEYKFYLAFENSNCDDYITEKFFDNGLKYNMVPIVMGAPKSTYKEVAPPNSFIHVDDFSSPKALAKYLKVLNKDEVRYSHYFDWKGSGEVTEDDLHDVFCRICGMLFYADFVPSKNPWNQGKKQLWQNVTNCLPQGLWNWNHSE